MIIVDTGRQVDMISVERVTPKCGNYINTFYFENELFTHICLFVFVFSFLNGKMNKRERDFLGGFYQSIFKKRKHIKEMARKEGFISNYLIDPFVRLDRSELCEDILFPFPIRFGNLTSILPLSDQGT